MSPRRHDDRSEARRYLDRIYGKRDDGSARSRYLHEYLDALERGGPFPDPAGSGRWIGDKRERTIEVLERIHRTPGSTAGMRLR